MPDQDAEPGFSVVDRRRRGEDDEAPPPGEHPPRFAATPPREIPIEATVGAPRPDLASFCVMLYGDALVHLGQAPDPATGEAHRDLDQARFTIDLLGVIQEKTEGNRTPEESAVLGEILNTLRIGFVRASRLVS